MAAMPSPTASSLAATMPNLSRSGRRAVKRRSPGGGEGNQRRVGGICGDFSGLCWKKGGWIPQKRMWSFGSRKYFLCVFSSDFFLLVKVFCFFGMKWCDVSLVPGSSQKQGAWVDG